jgi:hypothetical protein
LYEGQFIMARTSFSGPVASANGFIGTFTGNVVGNVVGDVTLSQVGVCNRSLKFIQASSNGNAGNPLRADFTVNAEL